MVEGWWKLARRLSLAALARRPAPRPPTTGSRCLAVPPPPPNAKHPVQVRVFDPLGSTPPRSFTLGSDALRDGVEAAAVWGDGVAALTGGGALVVVVGLADGRVTPLARPPPGDVAAMAVLAVPGSGGVQARKTRGWWRRAERAWMATTFSATLLS